MVRALNTSDRIRGLRRQQLPRPRPPRHLKQSLVRQLRKLEARRPKTKGGRAANKRALDSWAGSSHDDSRHLNSCALELAGPESRRTRCAIACLPGFVNQSVFLKIRGRVPISSIIRFSLSELAALKKNLATVVPPVPRFGESPPCTSQRPHHKRTISSGRNQPLE